MFPSSDDNRFLCACTAELIALTGVAPPQARAFVGDFSSFFLQLRRRGHDAPGAARTGTVVAWSAVLGGVDGNLRTDRSCRLTDVIGRRVSNALLATQTAGSGLERLIRAALERDGALHEVR